MAKREKYAIISIKFLFAWTIWYTKKYPQYLLIVLQEKQRPFVMFQDGPEYYS